METIFQESRISVRACDSSSASLYAIWAGGNVKTMFDLTEKIIYPSSNRSVLLTRSIIGRMMRIPMINSTRMLLSGVCSQVGHWKCRYHVETAEQMYSSAMST